MKTLSDASQLAALDAAIRVMQGGAMPDRRDRELLAEQLGVVRERVQRAKDLAEGGGR